MRALNAADATDDANFADDTKEIILQFVILVIDSTDRERLSVTREELYRMLGHEDLAKAGVLVYANKQDVKVRDQILI